MPLTLKIGTCILVSVEWRQRKPGYFGPALFVFLNPPAPALRFTAKETDSIHAKRTGKIHPRIQAAVDPGAGPGILRGDARMHHPVYRGAPGQSDQGRLQHRRDFVARPGAGGDGGAVPDIRLAGRHRLLQGVERVRPQPAAGSVQQDTDLFV